MKVIAFVVMLLNCSMLNAQQVTFTEHPITDAGQGNPGVFAADFDGDGDNDILASVNSPGALKWWRNEGDSPVMWTEFTIANEPGFYVYAQDINSDGHIDALSTLTNGQVSYWKNSGENPPTWEKVTVATGFSSPHGIFACDLDNDQDKDILATSAGLGKICWWEQDNDTWEQHEITNNFPYTQSVYAIDLNNDTHLDVIGACGNGDEVAVWYNQGGDPVTWEKQVVSDDFDMAHWVYACDINDDGFNDILGAAANDNEISWWKNNGDDPVSWTKYTINNNFPCALTAFAADLDNDDDLDVMATAWWTDDIAWWENSGTNPLSWTRHVIDSFNNGVWPIYACDIDNDQAIDIITGADVLTSGGSSAALTWWENSLVISYEDPSIYPNESGSLEAYPNPFKSSTCITFSVPQNGFTELNVYNVKGQKVRTLLQEDLIKNQYSVVWLGNDNFDKALCPGIYYNILSINGDTISAKKCLLIR